MRRVLLLAILAAGCEVDRADVLGASPDGGRDGSFTERNVDAGRSDAAGSDAGASVMPDTSTTEPPIAPPDAAMPPADASLPDLLPIPGNPAGDCDIPSEAQPADTSSPDRVIGDGTSASCTSRAFVDAVAAGGTITFDCGEAPVTITLDETARVHNDANPDVVIDGGGKVTLSGSGVRRILYMNTCDESLVWTTPNCDNQDHPRLTIQNLTFVDGNASADEDGGGAIFARGGRLKIVRSRFFRNRCADTGPDVGGAAVRVFDQYDDQPVYVVESSFGGSEALANVCSNGGGLSSIGVSFTVLNSVFSHNRAIGFGANPAQDGTPGGGSGGAIYNDGNAFTLTVCGTRIEDNHANEGGGAIFFVSNDLTGHLVIDRSTLRRNPSDAFENYPGIFYLGDGDPQVASSTLE